MAYFLSTSLGLGLAGIWLAMGIDEGARGCMKFLRWRHGRWRQIGLGGAGGAPLAEPSASV
jgi:Na+-driven multidrug efflux pump